ncbi:hypothetical protein GCM10007291_10800 [Gemmobacter nanjingensis]|uniref:Uncharacterized protein n=1 Tax=Gemmobacter nanjingensis TaxID=488454 RepID=A0ABQ3F9B1_9RHOB|nr:hypothetical protein [Gemmobacter nanjingensis]GHC14807.1 hypothetical protein GCM10007291_10800 [Gemmobacter nanjingensis]
MSRIPITRLLPLALSSLPLPALAITVADCTLQQGCACSESPLSAEEIGIVMGATPPQGADGMVFVFQDGDAGTWSPLTPEEIDIVSGGDGACDGPLVPEDGTWVTRSTLNSLHCGAGTAMMRSMIEGTLNKENPVPVRWNGDFSADTWRRAWIAANPQAEAPNTPTFNRVSPVELSGRDSIKGMTSTQRMVLLTPRSFRMDWQFEGQNEMGACGWSVTHMVRRTGG